MRNYILLIFVFSALHSSAQIFNQLRITADTIEVDKYKVEGKWNEQTYLRFNYGDYFILNPKDAKRVKDKIIQKGTNCFYRLSSWHRFKRTKSAPIKYATGCYA